MCGSDLHQYRAPRGSRAITIAGHEPCGVVADIGPGVTDRQARIGQRVMDHHYGGCGACVHCHDGWTQMCEEGSVVYGNTGDGAHAQYMKVPAYTLVPMPDDMTIFFHRRSNFLRYRYRVRSASATQSFWPGHYRNFWARPRGFERHTAFRCNGRAGNRRGHRRGTSQAGSRIWRRCRHRPVRRNCCSADPGTHSRTGCGLRLGLHLITRGSRSIRSRLQTLGTRLFLSAWAAT